MDKISYEEVCKMGDGWWWLWLFHDEPHPDSHSHHAALANAE